MTKPLAFGMVVAIAACTFAGSASRASVLFDESFDDADLTKRNWYDELAVGTNRIGPLGAGKGTAKEKGQNMEGTWICLSATLDGKPLPEATINLLRLSLTKDRYKTEKGSEILFDSSYSVDTTQDPAHINIVGTEGDLKGKEAQGIYSMADDVLTICYTMPGKKRPTAFASKPGSEAHFIIWKRVK